MARKLKYYFPAFCNHFSIRLITIFGQLLHQCFLNHFCHYFELNWSGDSNFFFSTIFGHFWINSENLRPFLGEILILLYWPKNCKPVLKQIANIKILEYEECGKLPKKFVESLSIIFWIVSVNKYFHWPIKFLKWKVLPKDLNIFLFILYSVEGKCNSESKMDWKMKKIKNCYAWFMSKAFLWKMIYTYLQH